MMEPRTKDEDEEENEDTGAFDTPANGMTKIDDLVDWVLGSDVLQEQLKWGGFSWGHLRLLHALDSHVQGFLCSFEVAELLGITRAATTGVVDRLEAEGLVDRFQQPDDRRKIYVSITQMGINLLKEIRDSLAEELREELGVKEALAA